MKQYGFINSIKFEATRTFLIRQARKVINLIGSMHLTPQKLYKSAEFGDATYYDRYGIIGFGKSFFNVGTDRKVDTIVHEFSHAVWTSEDTAYNARTAIKDLNFIAQSAQIYQTNEDRETLLYSAYLFENAVRAAQ
ncbi:M35 family metallopeptidase [Pseudoalteromonas sp. Z9A6]|nr:M35 family metallopeptidase [Pseudoalteromonas sp. Z9A6]